jgi:hypothetical protein
MRYAIALLWIAFITGLCSQSAYRHSEWLGEAAVLTSVVTITLGSVCMVRVLRSRRL